MTRADYSIYLCDPFGVRLGDASGFIKLQYTRVVNDVGTLKLWLPADFDTRLIRLPHGRIEVWRRLPGSSREYLDTEVTWLIQSVQWDRDDSGNISLLVEAETPLCLLRDPGRVISIYNNFLTVGQEADDLIKFVCLYQGITATPDQIGITRASSSAYPGSQFGQYITAQADLGLGPVLYSSFAGYVTWKPLLTVCKNIAQASADRGTYLAFDIMAPTPNTLELRTYIQQRGVDHRYPNGINPVIFGGEHVNVGPATLRDDRRREITAAWGGGANNPNNAGYIVAQPSYDSARIGESPFGWRETFVNDTQQTNSAALTASCQAAVYGGRPRAIYRGRLLSVPGCMYGLHWGWGDYVTVQDFGQSFDCRIEAITVTVEKNQEKIDAYARNDA